MPPEHLENVFELQNDSKKWNITFKLVYNSFQKCLQY